MARRKSPEEQLAALVAKQAQLKAQIDKKRALLKNTERKKDTRRKIIAGALALEHADIDAEFGQALRKLLNRYVERDEDRALFDLDPKAKLAQADAHTPANDAAPSPAEDFNKGHDHSGG